MSIFEDCDNAIDKLEALERHSKNHLKVPLRKNTILKNLNINRSDPQAHLEDLEDMVRSGVSNTQLANMNKVMQHDYLRKSMEERIKNKALIKDFMTTQKAMMRSTGLKQTKTSILRSKSVMN